MANEEPLIEVVSIEHAICPEGALFGMPAARVMVGGRSGVTMTPTEIFSEMRADSMPYRIVLDGDPGSQPLASFVQRAQNVGYCVAAVCDGSTPVDWYANLDELVLKPEPVGSRSADDLPGLAHTIRMAHTGDTFTAVSLQISVGGDADYEFARHIHDTFPGISIWLAATGSRSLSDSGLQDRLHWLSQRVIAEHWEDVRVIPCIRVDS